MRLKRDLSPELKYQAVIVESAARAAGLAGYEVVFELLPAEELNGVAAYGGFPVRYPSWRFGMEYERLEKGHRWGLSRIYELVINNDPTYAYLVRSNSLLEQKLVMAHVFGHADFFRNNIWFAPTDRKMLDTMGSHATRVRRHIDAHGQETVESFIDRVLSLETLVDPYLPLREHRRAGLSSNRRPQLSERARAALDALTGEPARERAAPAPSAPAPLRARGDAPTYDVLGYLAERAPLESWQQDVLRCLRAEAYYFAPQRMTKILNEGWASYWHAKLLTGGILEPSEILDFADCHSSATANSRGRLNPYKLGIELLRHAERRGLDLFQLRASNNDVTFVDAVADEEFLERHAEACGFVRVEAPEAAPAAIGGSAAPSRASEGQGLAEAKRALLQQLAWGGLPQIELVAEDAEGQGELLLVHHHDGRDLQLAQARDTLLNLAALWKRPVHLLTIAGEQGRRFVCDGQRVTALETREALERCRAA